jgi:hypothetical protein
MPSIAICTHHASPSSGARPQAKAKSQEKRAISSHRTFDEFCGYRILMFGTLFCPAMAEKGE